MRAFYHVSLWYEKVDLSQAASRGVRTTSEEFVNAALFLRLDLKFVPSTLAKTFASRYSRDFPDRVFFQHKSKMTSDCSVLNFYGVMLTENI